MKKIVNLIKNKKGSMMMEYFVLIVVGLIILAGFLLFLDQGSIFARKSLEEIGKLEKETNSSDTLGKFKRIE